MIDIFIYPDDREEVKLLKAILLEVRKITRTASHPTALQILFSGEFMPVTLAVGQSVLATPVETDAAGTVVSITDPTALAWTSSDPTIASVGTDEATGAVVFTAVAAGTVTVTVTDPANSLTTSDTITVTAPPATTLAIDFGTPTS